MTGSAIIGRDCGARSLAMPLSVLSVMQKEIAAEVIESSEGAAVAGTNRDARKHIQLLAP